MNSADIQNRIEDLAKEKGMTMYELSKVSGVSLEPKEGGKITKRDEAILEVSRSLNERNMERLVVYATGLRDSQDNK